MRSIDIRHENVRALNVQRHQRRQALLHCCDNCGHAGEWSDSWSWYGSVKDSEDGKPILRFCCSTCEWDVTRCEARLARELLKIKDST